MLSLYSPAALAGIAKVAAPTSVALFSTQLGRFTPPPVKLEHHPFQPPSIGGVSNLLSNNNARRKHEENLSSLFSRPGGMCVPAAASFASSASTTTDTWPEGKPLKHPGSPTMEMEESNDYMLMYPT